MENRSHFNVIVVTHKDADPASNGTAIKDNIVTGISIESDSVNVSTGNNVFRSGAFGSNLNGTPTFVGGANPLDYSGFVLTSGSSGKNAASDGSYVGARISSK
jgi:hypothetical protein